MTIGVDKVINYKKAKVKDIIRRYNNCTEVEIIIDNKPYRAVNYDKLTGKIQVGDTVLLNTTAVDLGLGSGGVHFVVSINDGEIQKIAEKEIGHIMKLRYTPLQFSVMSSEEEESPYHEIFNDFENLGNMPVIVGELHSMLAPVVFNIKRENPKAKIAYIMTDGGALPLDFSRTVAYLKERDLLCGTITFGHAFGGDLETVNIYTALIAAHSILKCDVAVVTMGPGIVGTCTKYGFTGIEQGYIVDSVNTLGGNPFFIPRMSFADERARHKGISWHSITILEEIVKTPTKIVIPKLEKEKHIFIQNQLKNTDIEKNHDIVWIKEDSKRILDNLQHYDFKLSTMGRSLKEDLEFFITAGAGGFYVSKYINNAL